MLTIILLKLGISKHTRKMFTIFCHQHFLNNKNPTKIKNVSYIKIMHVFTHIKTYMCLYIKIFKKLY